MLMLQSTWPYSVEINVCNWGFFYFFFFLTRLYFINKFLFFFKTVFCLYVCEISVLVKLWAVYFHHLLVHVYLKYLTLKYSIEAVMGNMPKYKQINGKSCTMSYVVNSGHVALTLLPPCGLCAELQSATNSVTPRTMFICSSF